MRAPQNYVGPVSTAGLMQLKAHNYVAADTYVWASHLNGWSRLGEQSAAVVAVSQQQQHISIRTLVRLTSGPAGGASI